MSADWRAVLVSMSAGWWVGLLVDSWVFVLVATKVGWLELLLDCLLVALWVVMLADLWVVMLADLWVVTLDNLLVEMTVGSSVVTKAG